MKTETVTKIMAKLGLRPPPPPAAPPPFLTERTPAEILAPTQEILQQGVRMTVRVTGPVAYGTAYYDPSGGLDAVAIRQSAQQAVANLKRMRRDALTLVPPPSPAAPLFLLT